MTIYGWDISNHDWDRARAAGRTVDLAEARKSGISFVTHKATEGNWYQDPFFEAFARQLDKTAFPVAGSYHALNHGIDPVAQADYWYAYVQAKHPDWVKHPCWTWQLDCEPLDGYKAPTLNEIVACGRRLQRRYGIPGAHILVYAPKWVYGDTLRGLPYRLWASEYVSGSRGFTHLYPGDRSGFWGAYSGQTPLVLQFSSKSIVGQQNTCDANAIRVSSEAELQALFLGKPAPAAAHPSEQTGLENMTPAERHALINDIANAVWEKKFTHKNTTANAGTWLVYANRFARSAEIKVDSLSAKVSSVVVDAQAVATGIRDRLLALLGGK